MTDTVMDRIVREPEARQISGLSRSQRYRLEREGKFPKKRAITGSLYGYRLSELMAWVEGLPERN